MKNLIKIRVSQLTKYQDDCQANLTLRKLFHALKIQLTNKQTNEIPTNLFSRKNTNQPGLKPYTIRYIKVIAATNG